MGTARRLYINGVSLVSLSIMLGGGSVLLVTIIRRIGIGTGYNTDSDIAISATLLFIGLPIWAIHHWLGQRTVRNNPDEAGSLFRAIYIYGALLITGISAAIVAMIAITSDQDQFATILVFGSFWMYFLFLEHGEARPTRRTVIARQLYFYTMSVALISLAMSAFFVLVRLPSMSKAGTYFFRNPGFAGLGLGRCPGPTRCDIPPWYCLGSPLDAVWATEYRHNHATHLPIFLRNHWRSAHCIVERGQTHSTHI